MRILENQCLRIEIADRGAELCGVYDKAAGLQRLWTADPAVWNRHAPILFPFVGRVTGGRYRVGGREYEMKTQHGFARDMDFECVRETDAQITHRLVSTPATREKYPCDFILDVSHALDPNDPRRLRVSWRIENTGEGEMYYAIGGHPGFLLPPGVDKADCLVMFPGRDALSRFNVTPEGFALPDQARALELEGGFSKYLPDIPDTWIFEGQHIDSVGIALPDGTPYVTLECGQFPMLGVWANPNGPFICLEPWYGRTDDLGFAGELPEKPGIQRLGAGESMETGYSILFHAPEKA